MGPKAKKDLRISKEECNPNCSEKSRKQPAKTKLNNSITKKSEKTVLPQLSFANSVLYGFHEAVSSSFNFSLNSKLRKAVVINQMKRFKVCKTMSPFERRVTSMAWHPVYSDIFVAGSKGGELILHSMKDSDDFFCPGIGAGGSIVGLKFDREDPCTVYTASITGNLRREDFHRKNSKTLLSTLSWEIWFSSLDICYKRNILLSGDCTGHAYLLESSGKKVWNKKPRLHSNKITHCEFNPHDENIFVTSSVDHSVKLWDLRMVAEETVGGKGTAKSLPIREFNYDKAVSAAYFSPSNGHSLLTTDQHSMIRIYSRPYWEETLSIVHPHRFFQHMTPIKAIWHPIEDIFMIGRYPDDNIKKNDSRTIDFYDPSNGNLLYQILSPSGKIVSLNAVNISGSVLASAAGFGIVFLKDENILNGNSSHHSDLDDDDDESDCSDDQPKKPQKPKKPKRTSKDNRIVSKKLKSLIS